MVIYSVNDLIEDVFLYYVGAACIGDLLSNYKLLPCFVSYFLQQYVILYQAALLKIPNNEC